MPFGWRGSILCGITATPPHREIHKTALGATESVHWEYREETVDAISELKRTGYQILSVEQAEGALYAGPGSVIRQSEICPCFRT